MTTLLPALAVAFAAFCVWLTVRIVNRREQWAKRTLAGLIGLPVLYFASFGPICWLQDRRILPPMLAQRIYGPLGLILDNCCSDRISELVIDYGICCSGDANCQSAKTIVGLKMLRVRLQEIRKIKAYVSITFEEYDGSGCQVAIPDIPSRAK
jgi:hypothetical protein